MTAPSPLVLSPARSRPRSALAARARPRRPALEAVFLFALTAALLSPFAEKAFHIDDPFYVEVARHIAGDPLDFYGLEINWYGRSEPLASVNQNPPLVSYAIALIGVTFGWSERSLHLAFIGAAFAVVLAVRGIARHLRAPPVLAALVALSMPVFLVSATTLMTDVLLLAFYSWSALFWLRGIDGGRHASLALAGFCASLAVLTKYFGVTLLPLLFAYGLIASRGAKDPARRCPRRWMLWLPLPVATLAGYEAYSTALYGHGLFVRAAAYAVEHGGDRAGLLSRLAIGLTFAGGCVLPVVWWAPAALGRRARIVLLVLSLAAFIALLVAGDLGGLSLREGPASGAVRLAHASSFAAASIALVLLVATSVWRERDRHVVFLALWILGTLAFATVMNWTTNGRVVLPIVPPLAVLLARGLGRLPARTSKPRVLARPALALGFAASFGLSWTITEADHALAESARRVAELVRAEHMPQAERTWFEGHWGFQHYMERAGARPVDFFETQLEPGDLLVVPGNNSNVLPVPPRSVALIERIEVPLAAWAATLAQPHGAGFYTSLWGPFPWVLGRPPHERYWIFRVEEPFRFARKGEDSRG